MDRLQQRRRRRERSVLDEKYNTSSWWDSDVTSEQAREAESSAEHDERESDGVRENKKERH